MANKPKFLKNLLTTASAVGLLAVGASEALGATHATNNSPYVITGPVNVAGAITIADTLQLDANARLGSSGGVVTIGSIDVNNKINAVYTVDAQTTIGSVVSNGGAKMAFTINAGQALTLTGTAGNGLALDTYDGFGDVTAAGAGAVLNINMTDAGNSAFTSNLVNGNNLTLNISKQVTNSANANGTFLSAGTVNINAASKLILDATGAAVKIAGAVNLQAADSVLELQSANGGAPVTYTLNGGSIAAAGDGVNGTLTLTVAGQNMTIAKNAAEAIGAAGARLKEMNIGVAAGKTVTVNPNLFVKQINVNTANNQVIFGGAINTGADGEMKLLAAANDIQINANSTIGRLDFNNTASVVKVDNNVVVTGNAIGNNTNVAHIAGTILFKGAGQLVGTATRLAAIEASAVGLVKLEGINSVTEVKTGHANAAFEFADGFVLNGTGAPNSGSINQTVNFASNMEFKGNGEVAGNIGAGGAVGNITVSGGAGKIVKIGGNVTAGAIIFATNAGTETQIGGDFTGNTTFTVEGILKVINDKDHDITGNVTTALANGGTIDGSVLTANKTLTIDGNIGGNNANALTAINITGGGNLALDGGNVNVKTIDLGGQAASVLLQQNNGTYRIDNLDNSENATMKVNPGVGNNVTLLANTGALNLSQILFMDNNSKLTVEDGINITTSGGIKNNGGVVGGNLVLDKAHVITGDVGEANSKLGDITLTGNDAAKFTQFKGNVFANNVILNGANTLTQFAGNVTATDIKGAALNDGTVEFINENGTPITVTSTIGAGNAVKVVKVSGGDVKVTAAVTSQDGYAFGANSTGKLTLDTQLLGNKNVTVARTDGVNRIVIKDTDDIQGNIGSQANPLGAIVMDNAATKNIKVNSATFFAGLDFAQADLHTVEIAKNGATISGIGATNAAKTVTVNDGITANFSNILNTKEGIKLGHAAAGGAIANFTDATLVSKLDGDAAGKGTANFTGNTIIQGIIGGTQKLLAVNFDPAGGKNVGLAQNITADTITLHANKISVDSNVTLTGKVVAAGSTVSLDKNTLTLTASNASAFTGEVALNTRFDGTNYGKIAVTGAGNSVNFNAGLTKLTVTIDDSEASLQEVSGKTITLVGTDGQATFTFADAAKVTVDGKDDFIQWTYTGQNAVFTAQNNSASALQKIGLESLSAQMFGDPKNTGDAAAFLVDLRKLHNQGKDDLVKQAVTRIEAVEATVGAMAQTVATVNSTIAARVADVTAPNVVGQVDVAEAAGVAAGDNDSYSYGAWATPFYSQGTQKLKGKTPGYKSKTGGVSVGFDTRANDTMTVGVALSVATDNLKFKGALAGDKTKANTYMFSVYGMQQLTDNWFLQGTASFGNSNMKNTALRVTANGNQTATGKYDSMTYGGQLLAGYHFPMSDTALVTPMGGLKYNRFNDTGYKETGTTSQNRTISKKSVDKIEGVLGVRATFFTEMSGVNVVPGVHGFVNYDFRGKRPNVTARLDGLNAASLNTDVAKPEKAIYNVGLNVKAMNGTMEYGAGYDAYFAKKYTAHQGSLKVRVNF